MYVKICVFTNENTCTSWYCHAFWQEGWDCIEAACTGPLGFFSARVPPKLSQNCKFQHQNEEIGELQHVPTQPVPSLQSMGNLTGLNSMLAVAPQLWMGCDAGKMLSISQWQTIHITMKPCMNMCKTISISIPRVPPKITSGGVNRPVPTCQPIGGYLLQ